jgi:hypothetical protein
MGKYASLTGFARAYANSTNTGATQRFEDALVDTFDAFLAVEAGDS